MGGTLEDMLEHDETGKQATFYYASRGHQPKLPAVKRGVEARVVEGSEEFRIVDSRKGIRAIFGGTHELFIRLPIGSAGAGKAGKEERNLLREVHGVLKMLEGKQSWSDCRCSEDGCRIAAVDGEGSAYMHLGTTSERYGGKWKTTMKDLQSEKHKEEHAVLSEWIDLVQSAAWRHFPLWLKKMVQAFQSSIEQPGLVLAEGFSAEVWPAMVCGRNVFLNLHVDRDFMWCMVTVVAEHDAAEGGPILCYFCFPTLRLAVPLRNGDLLLFNPKVPHCVSSRCNSDIEAYCISFYMDDLLAGGNDNKQKLSEEEVQGGDAILKELRESTKKRKRHAGSGSAEKLGKLPKFSLPPESGRRS